MFQTGEYGLLCAAVEVGEEDNLLIDILNWLDAFVSSQFVLKLP
jgi:hypothetical protein